MPFKLETCWQWYYFDFEAVATQETIDFVGENPGQNGKNKGLLGNTMDNFTCYYFPNNTFSYKKNIVPFFEKPAKVCLFITCFFLPFERDIR